MLAENMKMTSDGLISSRQTRRDILRQITQSTLSSLVRRHEQREAEKCRRVDEIKELRSHLCRQAQAERNQLQDYLFQQSKARAGAAFLLRQELRKNRDIVGNTVDDLRRKSRQFLVNTRYIRQLKNKELSRSLSASLGGMRSAADKERVMLRADITRARAEWLKTAGGDMTPAGIAADMKVSGMNASDKPVEPEARPSAAAELAERVFACIADNPDGLRLRELQDQLDVNRFKLMRAIQSLMEDGKVQKNGGSYFAR